MADSPVAGPDLRFAGGVLTIDLAALAENYKALAEVCAPARTAAVVKADAYGLGIDRVVPVLVTAGCRHFFVSLPEEGIAVRAVAPDAEIYVLNGLFGPEIAPAYIEPRLIPVLNSPADIRIWEAFCGADGVRHPCAIHVDTGMNRLGLTVDEALAFADENALTQALQPSLVLSHLACADQPGHAMNRRQLESFQAVAAAFPTIESSLANSAGIVLGTEYHAGLTRPGAALYGDMPVDGIDNPMKAVVTVEARVVQIRHARAGDTVSYGATCTLERDTVIAIAAAGYGDGYHRAMSGSGVPMRRDTPGAQGFVAGKRVPVLGRVTMDLTLFDITDMAEGSVHLGDFIELFGPNISIAEAASAAGTISYEMLTSLGRRYHRRYVGAT